MTQVEFKNIHGFIGDGGPFLSLPQCLWNLYTHVYPHPMAPSSMGLPSQPHTVGPKAREGDPSPTQ